MHRNVAELADVPRGTRRQSKAMTLDQVRALLALDLTPFWRAYIVTAIACGLRPGEMLGLRWQDIDFTGSTIRVRMCLKALPGPGWQARPDAGGPEDRPEPAQHAAAP